MARDATNTSSGMVAHRAAFDGAHPDQQVAHLRGEHGWTVFPSEETDALLLRSMHAAAAHDARLRPVRRRGNSSGPGERQQNAVARCWCGPL